MAVSTATLVWLLLALAAVSDAQVLRKQLGGPPSEFPLHEVPEPYEAALSSTSAMLFVDMSQSIAGDVASWDGELIVDSSSMFMFNLYFPMEITKLVLEDPENVVFDTVNLGTKEVLEVLGSEVPVTTYVIRNPKVGVWSLHVEADTEAVLTARKFKVTPVSDAIITVFNESPLKLVSNLNTYDLTLGNEVGLEVRMEDDSKVTTRSSLKDVVSGATMDVTFPDGNNLVINMKDDGVRSDKVADDGEYSATARSVQSGNYLAQASVSGTDATGTKFLRTAQHSFAITSANVEFLGTASAAKVASQNRIIVSVDLKGYSSADLSAYAEVWGRDLKTGKAGVAVCWIGGLVNVQKVDNKMFVELELDIDWISMASAAGPFVLRNVILQAVESWAVVDSAELIPINMAPHVSAVVQQAAALPRAIEITERMTEGVRPAPFLLNQSVLQDDAQAGLVLLHGYCAKTNPWAEATSDFTHGNYFVNPSASISNDAFAQRVVAWSSNLGAFTGLGHSQGGLVLVHMKNYYWSGFDKITSSGRILQSVGSPYQGCSAAGSLANIGKIFGVGCGTNVDLTTDGSALWMRGISAATRSKMFFYTSTYKLGTALGDYCSLPMNTILEWPNDGTSELDYTVLPGAINAGNKQQWCHINGFKYPAQTIDHTQNKAINGYAAR